VSTLDLGTLSGRVGLDISPLERGLGTSVQRIQSWSNQMSGLGKSAGKKLGEGLGDEAPKQTEDAGKKSSESFDRGFDASGLAARISGVLAAVGLGRMAKDAIQTGIETAAGMETAQIGFDTMLGSAQKAQSFLSDLQKFAAETPFEFPELQTAASSLVSIGIDADKVIPIMTTLGNVTSGMGTGSEGIKRATVAIQQMNAAQKISAEDLNQLRDAGIPVYDLLSGALGKTTQEIADMVQKGQLGKDALDAMMGALESGAGLERFSGLMDKQSQSLTGMLSTFNDTTQMGLANAVQPIIPQLKEALGGLSGWLTDTVFPAVTTGIGWAVNAARGLYDLFVNGDFTGALRDAFGMEEDSAAVGFLFGIRDAVIATKNAFVDVVAWVQANQEWLAPVTISILALVAGWKAYQTALTVGKAVVNGYKAAQAALNVVMSANPVALVVIALMALAAGLIYAYNHSERFREIVDTAFRMVGNVVQSVVGWITGTAVPWLVGAWETIVSGAIGLRDGVVGAFEGALRWVQDIFGPGWEQVQAILLLPINLARTLIDIAWGWVTDRFDQARTWVEQIFGPAWSMALEFVTRPFVNAWLAIQAAWGWILDKFESAGSAVSSWALTKWSALEATMRGPIDRAHDWIDTALNGIRGGFESAVDFIGRVWEGIQEHVKKPIRFVMTTVIDHGLIDAFNKVADFAHSPRLDYVTPVGFAGGGYTGMGGKHVPAGVVHRGEVVWSQDDINAWGGPGVVDAMRRWRGYEDGGIVGDIVGGIGSAVSAVMGFISDPIGSLRRVIDGLIGGIGDFPVAQIVAGLPGALVDGLASAIKTAISSIVSSGAGSDAFDTWWAQAVAINPAMASAYGAAKIVAQHESGFQPAVMNDWDVNAVNGTPSGGLMQFILPTFRAFMQAGFGEWLNPVHQLLAFWNYANSRYGGPWSVPGVVAVMNGQSYVGYANGTSSASKGWARVGEYGPEWINFGGGEQVLPNGTGALSRPELHVHLESTGDIRRDTETAVWAITTDRFSQVSKALEGVS